MYKILLIIGVVLLGGCARLMHGQMQPVRQISSSTYFTTCAGAVEDWGSCYHKAYVTCDGKYTVISKEDNNRGTKRDLTFACTK
jgi:hypothetical protein